MNYTEVVSDCVGLNLNIPLLISVRNINTAYLQYCKIKRNW